MGVLGSAFVRGNVCEDITGNELIDNVLVKVEFIDDQGVVVKGPFFGVTDAQGDFIIFIDPIDADKFNLKVSYRRSNVERMKHFTSCQGMDPENYL